MKEDTHIHGRAKDLEFGEKRKDMVFFFLSEKVKCEMKLNKEIKSVQTTIRKLIL